MEKKITMQYNMIPDDPIHDGRVHEIFPSRIERIIGNARAKDKDFYRMLYFDITLKDIPTLFETILSVDREGNINKIPITDYSRILSFIVREVRTEDINPDEFFKDKDEIGLGEEMSIDTLSRIVNEEEETLFSRIVRTVSDAFKAPDLSMTPAVREAPPAVLVSPGSPPSPPTPSTPPTTPSRKREPLLFRTEEAPPKPPRIINQPKCTIYRTNNGNYYANHKDVFNDDGELITYLPEVGKGKFIKLNAEQLRSLQLVYNVTEKQLPEVGVLLFDANFYMPLGEAKALQAGGILKYELSTDAIPTEVRTHGTCCRLENADYFNLSTMLDVNRIPIRHIEYSLSSGDAIDSSIPDSGEGGASTTSSSPVVPDTSTDRWTPVISDDDELGPEELDSGEPDPGEPDPATPGDGPVKRKI